MSEIPKSEVSKREEETLRWWNERDIFKKTVEKPAPLGDYIFYDGPPFATGLPHYGHIVASVIKDVVPRYFTMRGYRVPRVWGWDCHGLPIENIVEKELGFKHKKDIKEYGVAKFNERCREQVLTYAHEWEKIIPRIGRWADMENAYRTMDKPFMESVWWVFKQLYDRGLVYEDYRSLHVCPRCETTLSQQEVSEGYKDVKDIAVTVKFKLKHPEKIDLSGDVYMLAWTTTPWTLPGNVALAVGPEVVYSDISLESTTYILAKNKLDLVASGTLVGHEWKGADLVGLEYEPIFDYYAKDENLKNRERGWKVYAADFVTTDTGTGIAHEAPAFGADDWALLKRENLPFVQHVAYDGTMKPEVRDFAGLEVKPRSDDDKVRLGTDIAVLKHLQERGLVFAKENIVHSYPHCWRCDTPLLNYATSSWFVKIEAQKDALLKNARPINWSPAHIKGGRWGKWLEGARDWSISRQRFWASVMPVWRCQKCQATRVFGSASELEEASGKEVRDLHKHVVDEISFTCSLPAEASAQVGQCDGTMRRIPDVLDTWFDSGSMPYGQVHYPFENKDAFEKTFPAQFIAEGQDQTRAWFYYLHVLATSIFGTSAFQNVIVNGIVLAEDGKKMSKKLKNYPDPMAIVERYGADALRYYLLSSPVMQAENLNFAEKGVEEALRKNIQRLENVLAFYALYADTSTSLSTGGTPRDWKSEHVLDVWIIARLDTLIAEMTRAFDAYQLDIATRPLAGFIDDLSVWYLRRSRDRFKPARTTDGVQPARTEQVRSGGSGGEEGPDKTAALSTLRFVLHRLACLMAPSMPFFAEHVFQAVRESEDEESVHLASWPTVSNQPSFWMKFFGRDSGKAALEAMEVARNVVSSALEERDKAGIKVRQPLSKLSIPSSIQLAEEYLSLIADEVNVKHVEAVGTSVALDTTITDELREEGFVRDTIRAIQAYRKAEKLKPGENASYTFSGTEEERRIVEKYKSEIEQTTSTTIQFT